MKKKGWLIVLILILAGGAILLTRPSYINDGVESLEQGKYKEAVAAFEKQVAKGKKLGEAYRGLGIAYYELGEYNTCVEMFELAIKEGASPEVTTYRFIGNAYMELNQYEAAIEAYTTGMTAEGESKVALQEIQFNRIVAYEHLTDWENAKTLMAEYLQQYPEDEVAQKEAEFLKTR